MSIYCHGVTQHFICNFHLSAASRHIFKAGQPLGYTVHVPRTLSNQETNKLSLFCLTARMTAPSSTGIPYPAMTTTSTPTPTTPQPHCFPGLSEWINTDTPADGGDFEQMTPSARASFCPGGDITVECQTVDGIPSYSSGEILTCTADTGLRCSNDDNFPIPCSDYKIRYNCSCPSKFLFLQLTFSLSVSCGYAV